MQGRPSRRRGRSFHLARMASSALVLVVAVAVPLQVDMRPSRAPEHERTCCKGAVREPSARGLGATSAIEHAPSGWPGAEPAGRGERVALMTPPRAGRRRSAPVEEVHPAREGDVEALALLHGAGRPRSRADERSRRRARAVGGTTRPRERSSTIDTSSGAPSPAATSLHRRGAHAHRDLPARPRARRAKASPGRRRTWQARRPPRWTRGHPLLAAQHGDGGVNDEVHRGHAHEAGAARSAWPGARRRSRSGAPACSTTPLSSTSKSARRPGSWPRPDRG